MRAVIFDLGGYSVGELASTQPDEVVADLSDPEPLVSLLRR